MSDEEFCLKRIGMVEVDFRFLGGRQSAQVFVVRVVLEEGDAVWTDALENLLSDRCLA